MIDENNKEKKKCGQKGKAMIAYGIIQLSTGIISALGLTAIALNFGELKKEAKVFNECIEEVKAQGNSSKTAVNFCNGGK